MQRDSVWSALQQPWDLIIIGGGITGAGILRLAAGAGLRALLLEARDFSSGTSSRSSKLVHGGFRYLRNRQFSVTAESVREREWLLREARCLVSPLSFLLPNYDLYHIPDRELGLGVLIYDLLAPKWQHQTLSPAALRQRCPLLNPAGLIAAHRYVDAQVDDSRLVIRELREAERTGALALNYAPVEDLLRAADGRVCGVRVRDAAHPAGRTLELNACVVINAAGPDCDALRAHLKHAPPRLRKQRGSHLVFAHDRLPLSEAITLFHPRDRRAMFVLPWEGATVVGTTDLDHDPALEAGGTEPFAAAAEIEYILAAVQHLFPAQEITAADIVSSFAGLRPIIRSGDMHPSKASRAHQVWDEDGLITITGGKLTTFRIMARAALRAAAPRLNCNPLNLRRPVFFDPLPVEACLDPGLSFDDAAYLAGRYAADTPALLAAAAPAELAPIDSALPSRAAELRWAARSEAVVHLDDLLLRRVRLGLLLPNGAADHLPGLRPLIQPELGWDDRRWAAETQRYQTIWQRFYAPHPEG